MNIALSILSAAASAEAAGTAEAYSGPWENVYNAVHSTAEAVTEEAQGVVDRIQGLGDAHAQLADPDYWGSVGIITLTGILVVFLFSLSLSSCSGHWARPSRPSTRTGLQRLRLPRRLPLLRLPLFPLPLRRSLRKTITTMR